MSTEHLIGNTWTRAAAVALLLVAVAAAATVATGVPAPWHLVARVTMWAAGFLALLAGVHWSQRIYKAWMRGAAAINAVVTTVLFGLMYLVVVPVFWAILKLRERAAAGRDSQWHERRPVATDAAFFERMG